MPRKSNTRSPRKKTSPVNEESQTNFNRGERDYSDILQDLISNPALKYVAAGVATAVLNRIATRMSERYPEISSFIRENLDQFEGRLGDFSRGNRDEPARH